MASAFETFKTFFGKLASLITDFFGRMFGSTTEHTILDDATEKDVKEVKKVKEVKEATKDDENVENVENVEIENVNKKRHASEPLDSERIKRTKNGAIKKIQKKKATKNKKVFKVVLTSNKPFVLGSWALSEDEPPLDFTQPLNLTYDDS